MPTIFLPDEDTPRLVICQGPPLCSLEGDDALAAQERGCLLCKIEQLSDDGHTWVVIEHANAQ